MQLLEVRKHYCVKLASAAVTACFIGMHGNEQPSINNNNNNNNVNRLRRRRRKLALVILITRRGQNVYYFHNSSCNSSGGSVCVRERVLAYYTDSCASFVT